MNKLSFAVAVIALSTSMVAAADTTGAYNRHTGAYIEAGAGTNLYALGIISSDRNGGLAGVTGFSGNGAVGYNMTNWFGLESGLNYSRLDVGSVNHPQYESIFAPYASVRFTAPLGDRFSFIAKIGGMYANTFTHDDGGYTNHGVILPYVGLGAAYAVSEKVDINLQYQGAVYGVVNAGALTAGLTYHF